MMVRKNKPGVFSCVALNGKRRRMVYAVRASTRLSPNGDYRSMWTTPDPSDPGPASGPAQTRHRRVALSSETLSNASNWKPYPLPDISIGDQTPNDGSSELEQKTEDLMTGPDTTPNDIMDEGRLGSSNIYRQSECVRSVRNRVSFEGDGS